MDLLKRWVERSLWCDSLNYRN